MDFNTFLANFKALVDGAKLTAIVAGIVVNLILGVAVGIKNGNFNLKDLGNFFLTRVLPFILCYYGLGIYATIDPAWSWAVTAAWVLIDGSLLGAILQNLKELGVTQIPNILAGGKTPSLPG